MKKKTLFFGILGAAFLLMTGLFSLKTLPAKPAFQKPLPAQTVVSAESYSQPVETPLFQSLVQPVADAHSVAVEVKTGDNLTRLAKPYGLTPELIARVNGIAMDRLRVGQKLKIPTYRFSVVVDKSQNSLILKGDEDVLKTYTVSTGENNSSPVGTFKITDRLIHPTWYRAGAVVPFGSPENVLGTRWLGFDKKGYGIHGTTEPEKLGRQVTAGCVRMKNEEVEELFAFLSTGAEVTLVD